MKAADTNPPPSTEEYNPFAEQAAKEQAVWRHVLFLTTMMFIATSKQ